MRENTEQAKVTGTSGTTVGVNTSLPQIISDEVRSGRALAGDDYTEAQLATWFAQEKEAFYETDGANSAVDPWYAYMRFVNQRLGFSQVNPPTDAGESVLVIGPGMGTEMEEFARRHPRWRLRFLEASQHFRAALQAKWPDAEVICPAISGDFGLESGSQALVCAFSVLHHIPNVSKVVREVGRVLAPGGIFLVREPCSSMGDWRFPRSATPNERGISRALLLEFAQHAGLQQVGAPVAILFQPLNRILNRVRGGRWAPFGALYLLDRLISGLVSCNDHYWRDAWYKKIGPSSYFYVFKKGGPGTAAAGDASA